MANIKDTILQQYGIDIKQDNIFKLYKIDSADISSAQLEAKIFDRRKKWEQSINGPNEKFAKRDRAYLEKADRFEAILRKPELRKELAAYYGEKGGSATGEVTGLARKYFGLISSTTKVDRDDVEFFLKYFPEEKKNKKSILSFLKSEYKVIIVSLGGGNDTSDETSLSAAPAKTEPEPERKKKKAEFLVNLFSEQSLIRIRKCELNFLEARNRPAVVAKYPELNASFYEYLSMGRYKTISDFQNMVAERRADVFKVRNEFGTEYLPLVDLYNDLASVSESPDVRDNFEEFKLLIMYPALTPYMYEIGEIKKDSLNTLYNIANEEYSFSSLTDFLVSYFNVVYDNFGIYEDSIKKLMNNAQKQAGREKLFSTFASFFARRKGMKIPANLKLVYALSYFPIHIFAFIFRVFAFILEKTRYLGVILGVMITLMAIVNAPSYVADLIFQRRTWVEVLQQMYHLKKTGFLIIGLSSIRAILELLLQTFAPGGFVGYFLWKLSVNFRKLIDIKGIDRNLDAIIDSAKRRLIEQNEDYPDKLLAVKLPLILTNFIGLIIVIAVFIAIV